MAKLVLGIEFAISKKCNEVVMELLVMQFWSKIILVIANHAYYPRPNCTPLSSITIIYLLDNNNDDVHWPL